MLGPLLALALAPAPIATAAAPSTSATTGPTTTGNELAPPRRRGRRGLGLGIAAGAFGVAWFGMKMTASVSDPKTAREIDRNGGYEKQGCVESCYVGPVFHITGSPLLVLTAGMLGGSMHMHGRWLGRTGRGLGRTRAMGRNLAITGGALLVGGIAGLTTGLLTAGHARTEVGYIAIREVGWWSATALGLSGAALAGLGHGILRGQRESRRGPQVAIAPMLGGSMTGISIAGRF